MRYLRKKSSKGNKRRPSYSFFCFLFLPPIVHRPSTNSGQVFYLSLSPRGLSMSSHYSSLSLTLPQNVHAVVSMNCVHVLGNLINKQHCQTLTQLNAVTKERKTSKIISLVLEKFLHEIKITLLSISGPTSPIIVCSIRLIFHRVMSLVQSTPQRTRMMLLPYKWFLCFTFFRQGRCL